jgi:hypothetical protein
VINVRYNDLIEAIYSGADRGPVSYTVRYKDGRTAVVNLVLRVVDV